MERDPVMTEEMEAIERESRLQGVLQAAEGWLDRQRPDRAAPLLRTAQRMDPGNANVELALTSMGLEGESRARVLVVRQQSAGALPVESRWSSTGRVKHLQWDVLEVLRRRTNGNLELALEQLLVAEDPVLVVQGDESLSPHLGDACRALGIPMETQHGKIRRPRGVRRRKQLVRPLVSVLVTAQGNTLGLSRLLDQLVLNDLSPRLYEVLVVDSGSQVDLAEIVNVPNRPVATRLYSGSTCGKSRNRALAVARGDWILFLDDQALPDLDGLRRHVVGQSGLGGTTGILGNLSLCDEEMETRLEEAARYSVLFSPRIGLDSGKRYPWTAFDTRNLSICRRRLVEVGGFDPKIDSRQALDLDLGRRLHESSGIELLFDPAIAAVSTEKVGARAFIRRQQELGSA
ncbi:MAG: glycosyltransferase family 2 protein, partial [Myxococcota bacterium]|nr:glycosyltransferase family 2 protein [Myxococcota bacterium]